MVGIITIDNLEVGLPDNELVNLHDGIEKRIIKECTTPYSKNVHIKYNNTFRGGLRVFEHKDFFEYELGNSGYDVLHDHSSMLRSVGVIHNGRQHRVYVSDTKNLLDSYLKK